jgi:hypothetical protein
MTDRCLQKLSGAVIQKNLPPENPPAMGAHHLAAGGDGEMAFRIDTVIGDAERVLFGKHGCEFLLGDKPDDRRAPGVVDDVGGWLSMKSHDGPLTKFCLMREW